MKLKHEHYEIDEANMSVWLSNDVNFYVYDAFDTFADARFDEERNGHEGVLFEFMTRDDFEETEEEARGRFDGCLGELRAGVDNGSLLKQYPEFKGMFERGF